MIQFKPLLASIFFLLAPILGLGIGLCFLFIGGIVGIADALKSTPTDYWILLEGFVKVVFAAPVGWGLFFISSLLGTLCLEN